MVLNGPDPEAWRTRDRRAAHVRRAAIIFAVLLGLHSLPGLFTKVSGTPLAQPRAAPPVEPVQKPARPVDPTSLAGRISGGNGRATPCKEPNGVQVSCFAAATAWPSAHRDGRNSDHIPFATPRTTRVAWTALEGTAVLVAPTIGPEGNLYATTGRGPGTSHLHAFDRHGTLLWESDPQESLDDLDSGAVIGAPVIDRAGDLYLGDINQVWAFHPDGAVKWVAELPEGSGPFGSLVMTPDGLVGGVTSDARVAFYDRRDGRLATGVLQLPTGPPPEPRRAIPGLWAGGLMDPEITLGLQNALFGLGVEVANTPAVHPTTGRLFVPAVGDTPETGSFFGIDVVDGRPEVAFQASIGPRSGTSPAIAPDGATVYVVDGNRVLYAFDTESGDLRWLSPGIGAVASPSVDADGTLFAAARQSDQTSALTAVNPDGTVEWTSSYEWLARLFLPVIEPVPPYIEDGTPMVRTNSVVSTSPDYVYVVLTLGYRFDFPVLLDQVPRIVLLVALRPTDGAIVGITRLRDTSEGIVSIGADGRLYVSHAAFRSSVFYYAYNVLLPSELRVSGPPRAGFSALEANGFVPLATLGVAHALSRLREAIAALEGGAVATVPEALRHTLAQIEATTGVVDEGEARGELIDAANIQIALRLAARGVRAAIDAIGTGSVTPEAMAAALAGARSAEDALEAAAAALVGD